MRLLTSRLGAVYVFPVVLLLAGCGGPQQAPRFEQAYGAIDSPCAVNAAASDTVQHCTAHVLMVNRGGEGLGHATMVVELKDPKAGASGAATVKCGRPIPDVPGGSYTDLVCAFDVPPGKAIGTVPSLQNIDYTAAVSGSSSNMDLGALSTLVLAGATVLLGVATLVAVLGRRPAAGGDAALSASAARTPAASAPPGSSPEPHRRASANPAEAGAEYNIPPLPR